ncbi:MAG: LTA synthase family protein [Paludibacteraceae bacterium]|nr:LTA synthase family protein [Paludibacteraceae bacterium]
MRRLSFFFVKNYLFWVLFFVVFKAIFLVANHSFTAALSAGEILDVFLHGLKMDLSAAGYLSLLPGVMLTLAPLFPKAIHKATKVYTLVILIPLTILGLADLSLYPSWGTRLDSQVIPYLGDPVAVVSSVSNLQLVLSFLAIALIVFAFYLLYSKVVANKPFDSSTKWYKATPLMLLFTALLFLPIRGGVDTAPLNFNSVYFSDKTYANHAAYNYFWSFFHALTHNTYDKNPLNYMDDEEAERIMKNAVVSSADSTHLVVEANGKPVNVVIVILESFSNKVIYPLAKANDEFDTAHGISHNYFDENNEVIKNLTPNLNRYCNEGITFTNFYATGTRSDRGLSALLGAFPALIKASSILEFAEKIKSVTFLPQMFGENGYDMSFYYGGDINFYNTNILLLQSGIKNIVERSSFPIAQSTAQKWGAPDEFLYSRLSKDIKSMKTPFFTMVYNISSHEPFDVPEHFRRVKGTTQSDNYLNSAAYTDSCLGAFIEDLRKSPAWENTLVVITSDHTSLLPEPSSSVYELSSYRVPMIWTGGVVKESRFVDKICSQTDLYATLREQLRFSSPLPEGTDCYSHCMFDSVREFAFFFRPDGWGFVSPEQAFYSNIDNGQRSYIFQKDGVANDSIVHFAEAYAQYLHNDFIKR